AVKVSSPGYGGPIDAIVGISTDGKVTGVTIIGQQETPGLGSNVSGKRFREGFLGKDVSRPIKLKKDGGDIDAITGATISSRAVTRGVASAGKLFLAVAGK
ncbi:MAG TPA: FMN-binding protein, partial [Firmicutes bacterium]|nr:FMN-binding protein [Bacillota bacterium]